MDKVIVPDIEWYLQQSKKKGMSPRCPFAVVTKCPRFYQSLSLLGHAGSTEIPEKEHKRLLRAWRKSPLWPTTAEQSTGIGGTPGDIHHFTRFCPEVSFERFGLFASNLCRYATDADRSFASAWLIRIGAPRNDWRWTWCSIEPEHYSECQLYSLLLGARDNEIPEDILELRPNFWGIGLNLNALWRRFIGHWK